MGSDWRSPVCRNNYHFYCNKNQVATETANEISFRIKCPTNYSLGNPTHAFQTQANQHRGITWYFSAVFHNCIFHRFHRKPLSRVDCGWGSTTKWSNDPEKRKKEIKIYVCSFNLSLYRQVQVWQSNTWKDMHYQMMPEEQKKEN
jgi:hypothetical protein